MAWKQVESSNLRAIQYDPAGKDLDVQFKNGSVYRYHNVAPTIAKQLETADSVGSYFAEYIKNSYECDKLS